MRRALIVLSAVLLLGSGCSVPTDSAVEIIEQEELPESLRNTTTTTSTTPPTLTEDFVYYVLQQRAEQETRFVVAVTRQVEIGLNTAEALARMFADEFVTADEEEEGLINRLTGAVLVAVDENESGVATVRLEIEEFLDLANDELADIAAQLVWTLTALEPIDAILVEINGQPTLLPTEEGDESESVTTDDFPIYDREFEFPEAPEETTTTTTTTTTAPTTTAGADS